MTSKYSPLSQPRLQHECCIVLGQLCAQHRSKRTDESWTDYLSSLNWPQICTCLLLASLVLVVFILLFIMGSYKLIAVGSDLARNDVVYGLISGQKTFEEALTTTLASLQQKIESQRSASLPAASIINKPSHLQPQPQEKF